MSGTESSQFTLEWPPPAAGEIKQFHETTHRVCTPETTFERFAPKREAAGITRLADLTKLDIIGIPTYMAVRPQVDIPEDNITVYNGKGITKMQAKVSAMMEAFERHAAERHGRPAEFASYADISKRGPAVHPRELILPEGIDYSDQEFIEWVQGTDLMNGEAIWVPAAMVFCPYALQYGAHGLGRITSSNGLASGNSLAEAINQGLAEVIERDADALARVRGDAATVRNIDAPLVLDLIRRFHNAGTALVLKDMTSDLGIPALFASVDDPETQNPVLLCGGFGCHPSREIAAIRAITEAAQSRCTFISGSREDLINDDYKREYDYHELKRSMAYWYEERAPFREYRDLPDFSGESHLDDIEHMLAALRRAGLKKAIALNLTHAAVGVPVVKVIVPGLEENMEHSERRGPRLRVAEAAASQPAVVTRPNWLKKWFGKPVKPV